MAEAWLGAAQPGAKVLLCTGVMADPRLSRLLVEHGELLGVAVLKGPSSSLSNQTSREARYVPNPIDPNTPVWKPIQMIKSDPFSHLQYRSFFGFEALDDFRATATDWFGTKAVKGKQQPRGLFLWWQVRSQQSSQIPLSS